MLVSKRQDGGSSITPPAPLHGGGAPSLSEEGCTGKASTEGANGLMTARPVPDTAPLPSSLGAA